MEKRRWPGVHHVLHAASKVTKEGIKDVVQHESLGCKKGEESLSKRCSPSREEGISHQQDVRYDQQDNVKQTNRVCVKALILHP